MRTTLLSLCLLVACGSGDRTPPTPVEPDAATTPAPDAPTTPVPDAAQVRTCGGFANLKCTADEFCDYEENTCGATDGQGTCEPRPAACPAVVGPQVCGCDGKAHATECAAEVDGTDLNANGTCDKVAGKFACGYLLCDLRNEYCRVEPHARGPETYACMARQCTGTANCACLAGERCGTACAGDDKVGLTLTCPATP